MLDNLQELLDEIDASERQAIAMHATMRDAIKAAHAVAARVDAIVAANDAAASAPETRETVTDPNTDFTLDDFHGQQIPRASRITIITDRHWRGELGANCYEGSPEGVASLLRAAAADAASFIKSTS